MVKNSFYLCLLMFVALFTSCKQQKVRVLPGAVITQDGTKDGLNNVKNEGKVADVEYSNKVTLSSDLLFPTNSSYLTEEAKVELDKLVKQLKKESTTKVRVDGYTDATGTEQYNVWLSEKRAVSVKNYLEAGGIAASRISTKGFGPANPVGNNKTPEGRQKNRRVEVLFLK